MKKPFVSIFLSAVIALSSISYTEARTWTQAATGRKIDAEMVKVEGANVVLRLAGGRTATVPVASLSEADQAYIAEASAAGGRIGWRKLACISRQQWRRDFA